MLSIARRSWWVGLLLLMPSLDAQCMDWLPNLGAASGMNNVVDALATFDDGSGTALYAGGAFTSVDGVAASRVARWDGTSWSALGAGTSASVFTLVPHDDGSGPALYAGGPFGTAGGLTVNGIARWKDATWSALGGGVVGSVWKLVVFDDGGGAELYAAGNFSSAGGVPASNIARWDGSAWSALGSGLNGTVDGLCVFDDGGGAALYAGGNFTSAGGVSASRVARWKDGAWSALGSGVNGNVVSLAVYDDGSGPGLVVAGAFTSAGGASANRIARWKGGTWSTFGSGLSSTCLQTLPFDDGSGTMLYAIGLFSTAGGISAPGIARWNGSAWSSLGVGLGGSAYEMTIWSDGILADPDLCVGGAFTSAGGASAGRIAMWRGCGSPTPTLSAVTPDHGPRTGTSGVALTGTHLSNVSEVLFGGEPVAFTVTSDTEITVDLAPTTTTGWVDVQVTNPSGSVTLADGFDFFEPPSSSWFPCAAPRLVWSGYPTQGEDYTLTTLNLGASHQILLLDWSATASAAMQGKNTFGGTGGGAYAPCLFYARPDFRIALGNSPSYTTTVPNTPSLLGTYLSAQAVVLGPATVTTQVLHARIGE